MIYPTRTAVLSAAAGAPVALLLAVAMPGRWFVGLAWPIAILVMTAVDALAGRRAGTAKISVPPSASVGATVEAVVSVALDGARVPASAEVALAPGPLVTLENDGRMWIALRDGRGAAVLPLATVRRGTARFEQLWLRWRGPLGLAWQQRVIATATSLPILPDIRPLHDRGAQIFQRHALQGL
ncbi:hypothetical protein, partial [Pseudomonas sp. RA_15y_Pfl1_P12]|uniref:hypothetical protein n=1 Tax=Pseudomonas sp. RA_15y_Pfl1_P12 TaxID=3088703 RepID=UPI0030DD8A6B